MQQFDSSPAFTPGLRFWLPGPIRRLTPPRMPAKSLGSRRVQFLDVLMALRLRRICEELAISSPQCGLPVRSTRSASGLRFSKLNSRPVDASVYASPGTSRHPAQDSRSRWFATPFLWGSFIPDCTPVYPDDCAPSRSRLCRIRMLPSRDCKPLTAGRKQLKTPRLGDRDR